MDSLRFTHFLVVTINMLIILPLFSAYWVFSCFRNPPNSDMDYRIVLRAYVIILVRVYTHVGWAARKAQHNIFDSEKLLFFPLVLLVGFEPRSMKPWVRRSTIWATMSLHKSPPFGLIHKTILQKCTKSVSVQPTQSSATARRDKHIISPYLLKIWPGASPFQTKQCFLLSPQCTTVDFSYHIKEKKETKKRI